MSIKAVDKLNKKVPKVLASGKKSVGRIRTKISHYAERMSKSFLERSPQSDEFMPVTTKLGKMDIPVKNDKKNEVKNARIGDFLVNKNSQLAQAYKQDLIEVAQLIPEASFAPELNMSSTKRLEAILDKLADRSDQFDVRGFSGVVRDTVRATVFIPDADKNYVKIINAMESKGYKVANTFAEDANGNVIFDENHVPKMISDVDVRFGSNAVPSGYEDVQMRFEKGGNLYELLILPGRNYLTFKDFEHKYVYESSRKYKKSGLIKDPGAEQIIKAILREFRVVTRQLYDDAKLRDTEGARKAKRITFTKEAVENVNKLFASLKELYFGKYSALSPSKRKKPFKETRKYKTLDLIEQHMRVFLDTYKPID